MSELSRTPAAPTPFPTNTSPAAEVAREWPVLNQIDLDVRMWRDLDPVERALRMERNDHAWWTHHRLAKLAEAQKAQPKKEAKQ